MALQANILAFDYRGVGQSEGTATSARDLEQDTLAAYTYLTTVENAKNSQIVIHGWSLGGGAAAAVRAKFPGPLVSDRSFSSLGSVAKSLLNGVHDGSTGAAGSTAEGSGRNSGAGGSGVGTIISAGIFSLLGYAHAPMACGLRLTAVQTALPVLGATVVGATLGYLGLAGELVSQYLRASNWDFRPVEHWQQLQRQKQAAKKDGEDGEDGEKPGTQWLVLFHKNDGR
jgi:pimeloyl-ACP methyl ester carboxylesterase